MPPNATEYNRAYWLKNGHKRTLKVRLAELEAETELLRAKAQYLEARLMWNAGEVARLRAALAQIQHWDCLNPPDPKMCADHPWLKRLVDAALDSPKPDRSTT